MLILISLVPQIFALNPKVELSSIQADIMFIQSSIESTKSDISDNEMKNIFNSITKHLSTLKNEIQQKDPDENIIRTSILQVQRNLKDIESSSSFIDQANASNISSEELKKHTTHLYSTIDYAPWWIIAMISISLGIGTMF